MNSPVVTGADHLGEDRAGEVRLAGAGSAHQQQATALGRAPRRNTLGIVAAHRERLALRRRLRLVPGEGPVPEATRDAASARRPARDLSAPRGAGRRQAGSPRAARPRPVPQRTAVGFKPGDLIERGCPVRGSPCRRVGVLVHDLAPWFALACRICRRLMKVASQLLRRSPVSLQ